MGTSSDGAGIEDVEEVPSVDVTGKQYRPFDKLGTDVDLGSVSSVPFDCDATGGAVAVATTSITCAEVAVVGGSCGRSFCFLSEDDRTSNDNLAPIAK